MNLTLAALEPPFHVRFQQPLSNDEFLRLCDLNEPLHLERETNGEIAVMSSTGSAGGSDELSVGIELGMWARVSGVGKVFGPSSGFALCDGSIRAADAALISWTEWDALSTDQQRGYAPFCPNFIIELRSYSDRLPPLQAKMEQWLDNGAELAWLIDPLERTVHIYCPSLPSEIHIDPSSVQGTGIVAGFELILSRVWGSCKP